MRARYVLLIHLYLYREQSCSRFDVPDGHARPIFSAGLAQTFRGGDQRRMEKLRNLLTTPPHSWRVINRSKLDRRASRDRRDRESLIAPARGLVMI